MNSTLIRTHELGQSSKCDGLRQRSLDLPLDGRTDGRTDRSRIVFVLIEYIAGITIEAATHADRCMPTEFIIIGLAWLSSEGTCDPYDRQ